MSIKIFKCTKVTDVGLAFVARSLLQLQFLNIGVCHRITDVGIHAIAASLHDMNYLQFSECHKVTDDAVLRVAKSLRNLQHLDMYKCTKITDTGLKHITSLQLLTFLSVGGCNVTKRCISHVKGSIKGLKVLSTV